MKHREARQTEKNIGTKQAKRKQTKIFLLSFELSLFFLFIGVREETNYEIFIHGLSHRQARTHRETDK